MLLFVEIIGNPILENIKGNIDRFTISKMNRIKLIRTKQKPWFLAYSYEGHNIRHFFYTAMPFILTVLPCKRCHLKSKRASIII